MSERYAVEVKAVPRVAPNADGEWFTLPFTAREINEAKQSGHFKTIRSTCEFLRPRLPTGYEPVQWRVVPL